MKRTSRQTASKSGTPKTKSKRMKYNADQVEKKIREWRSTSALAEKKPHSSSNFVDRLWSKVDKTDPEAVKKVLDLHASGKGGDEDAIYFSSSRFWHIYKLLKDEFLSYFLLSLWSVHLEAACFMGDSVLVGDENCAMINTNITLNHLAISEVLNSWNTPQLVDWYEKYYNLAFGQISLTDSSEITRNVATTFNHSANSEDMPLVDRSYQQVSIEVQPPDDTDQSLEQTIDNLYNQLDRTRPRFLYAEKDEVENSLISDRIIVVLNVMSDVNYVPPLGWSFQPFTLTPSVCIPLELFEGLGVYEQITLARDFLLFKGDTLVNSQEVLPTLGIYIKWSLSQYKLIRPCG